MKVLLLGLNFAPEPIGIGPYTTGLAQALAGAGHEVQVIAGHPYYPGWQAGAGSKFWRQEKTGRLTLWRVPHYVPPQPDGPGRLLQQISFALAALPLMLFAALFWRADRVIAIAPSLAAAPVALVAARLAGAQSWLHLQDFELEAALATKLLSRRRVFVRLLSWLERRILCAFDRVSTISPAMCRRLAAKGVRPERISEHRNWGELASKASLPPHSTYRAQWNILTPHVALYSGALGRKQGLELLIKTARRLAYRDDLTFVICGNGPYRGALEAMASDCPNIRFFDLQPAERLGDLLSLATLHLLPQIAGAADLVLPSKLPNMLASARPVVATAQEGTGLHAELAGCGLVVEPDNVEALAEAISRLCDDQRLRQGLGAAGRLRAQLRWQRQALLSRFVAEIEGARQETLPGLAEEPR